MARMLAKSKIERLASVLQPLASSCAQKSSNDVRTLPTDGSTDPGQVKELKQEDSQIAKLL